MASGFVNQFDPPRRYDRKSKLPSSLLNFEQNRLRTKRLSTTIENNFENNTSSFENVMKKKQINEFNGSGSRTEFMTTEDGIFTLNTEDNQAIILE